MSDPTDRRRALKLLGGSALALSAAQMLGCAPAVVRPRSARRPNIVVIMTDDHAQSALGVYGSRILKTPQLDRIGNEGLRQSLHIYCTLEDLERSLAGAHKLTGA